MIEFQNCNNIVWNGPGNFFGNGYRYRPGGDLSLNPGRPRLLRFDTCNNCDISQVTLWDSPMFHVTVIGNNNVMHDMSIFATHIGTTDGFDVSGNNNYVHDVTVENGDECVTVKTPTNGFLAENISCRWTAGCNVGSFGQGTTGVSVQNVLYSGVTLSNSDAGVMLKSYPNCQGTVRNLTYENFKVTNVAYPFYIDGNWEAGSLTDTGSLLVEDVTVNGFTGSGTPTRPGVAAWCNSKTPCTGLKFSGVSITGALANQFTHACGTGVSGLPAC